MFGRSRTQTNQHRKQNIDSELELLEEKIRHVIDAFSILHHSAGHQCPLKCPSIPGISCKEKAGGHKLWIFVVMGCRVNYCLLRMTGKEHY
jgi:hypothetical protein